MPEYQAPIADMKFVLRELVDMELLAQLPGFAEMTPDVADAVLDEAAKFAAAVLSPLNRSGDLEGVRWRDGQVLTAGGWKQAYARFAADGWNALSCPAEFGGQNLPRVLSALIEEMWNGANVAFALCPMLTRGAIDALELRGTASQRDDVLAENGERRVDRHDESDGTAGRFRPVGRAYPGRAHGRRPLPGDRTEDFHHLWRARSHRQHHAYGAGARRRSAGRRQRHVAVSGAQVPGQCRRFAGRTQRCALSVGRAQARHPCESDLRAGFRPEWRRAGGTHRRGKSRSGIHVHHDERRPLLGRHRRGGSVRARLSNRARLCPRADPRHGGRQTRRCARADRAPSRRAAHAACS